MRKVLERRGWLIDRHRPDGDRCPEHNQPAPRKPKEASVTTLHSIQGPATAAPPIVQATRQPTREDNRRITDELDKHYELERGYKGAESDEKIAKRLDMPSAWVRDIRLRFYGEENTNEAAAAHAKLILALEERAKKMERDIEKMMDAQIKLANDIAALRRQP